MGFVPRPTLRECLAGGRLRSNMSKCLVIFVGLTLAMGGLTLAGRSQAPDGAPVKAEDRPSHRVVRVTGPEARQPAEVSVAINPVTPDHVVAVSFQARRPGQESNVFAYASEDGGLSWRSAVVPNPGGRGLGDPAVAFGQDGVVHHVYIAPTGIRHPRAPPAGPAAC